MGVWMPRRVVPGVGYNVDCPLCHEQGRMAQPCVICGSLLAAWGENLSVQTNGHITRSLALRASVSQLVAMAIGGLNRVIPTFRACASRPAAQESLCRPAEVCGIVETISDHVLFISPSSGVYMGGVRQVISNEMIFIYAVR